MKQILRWRYKAQIDLTKPAINHSLLLLQKRLFWVVIGRQITYDLKPWRDSSVDTDVATSGVDGCVDAVFATAWTQPAISSKFWRDCNCRKAIRLLRLRHRELGHRTSFVHFTLSLLSQHGLFLVCLLFLQLRQHIVRVFWYTRKRVLCLNKAYLVLMSTQTQNITLLRN